MIKIVVAMDSFKESMSALDACKSVQDGFQEVLQEECAVTCVPMADGGEGTVQTLVDATGGTIIHSQVRDPLMRKIDSFYGLLGNEKTAVIEMAAASGLALIEPHRRNPAITTTFGTGQLILDALDHGVSKIILGIGGSATNDGGVGMITALGGAFLDKNKQAIDPGGEALRYIHSIDLSRLDNRLQQVSFEVACDVTNPLTGTYGASYVFAPQKGATSEMVEMLDQSLSHFSDKVFSILGKNIKNIPGSGAAGGLGGGCIAFLNATLAGGVDIIIELLQLDNDIKDADLVITGEGKLDRQTIYGKTPIGVARVAKKYEVPVIALAGNLDVGYEVVFDAGIDTAFPIVQGITSLEAALDAGKDNLYKTARNLAKVFQAILRLH